MVIISNFSENGYKFQSVREEEAGVDDFLHFNLNGELKRRKRKIYMDPRGERYIILDAMRVYLGF